MKFLKLALLVLLFPFIANAQEAVPVSEGSVKMGKEKMWAFSATYRHSKSNTSSVMHSNMEKAGLKHSKVKKGVTRYKGVAWTAINMARGDYYYKIKSKKGKTTVYIAASKGYDNFVTSANDAVMAAKITEYLQALDGQITNAIAIQQKEAEMKAIAERNEALSKELSAAKAQEANKSKELQTLRKSQYAPAPVK